MEAQDKTVTEPEAAVETALDTALETESKPALNPMQVMSSVFAAGLGVQSSKNRERDFKQGRFGVFIAAGVIFTVLFVGVVFTIVPLSRTKKLARGYIYRNKLR